MNELDKYIETRKKASPKFAKNYAKGYEQFKIGILLKQARLEAGLTQEQVQKNCAPGNPPSPGLKIMQKTSVFPH